MFGKLVFSNVFRKLKFGLMTCLDMIITVQNYFDLNMKHSQLFGILNFI